MIPRGQCQACCGGGVVMGGGAKNGDPRGRTSPATANVGHCMRCAGSGVECDDDYALRVRSLRQSVAA